MQEVEILEFTYRATNEGTAVKLEVIDPNNKTIPETLYKLFSVTPYTVDSLINNYIFGNHPQQFNDLFDCHQNLILQDDERHKALLIEFIKEYYEKGTLENLNEAEINERIIEGNFDISYITFGISCFTSNPYNVLMWAYYGNNSGFMVEYDHSKFPVNFQGPFPINYQEEIEQVSQKKYGPNITLLYQSTVKSKAWEHEKEWRFLIRSQDGRPLIAHGYYDHKREDIHDRKFNYSPDCILSITFGNRFIKPYEIKEVTKDNILKVIFKRRDDLRIKIFDYCINNEITTTYGLPDEDLMTLKFRKSQIVKKSDLEYWIH